MSVDEDDEVDMNASDLSVRGSEWSDEEWERVPETIEGVISAGALCGVKLNEDDADAVLRHYRETYDEPLSVVLCRMLGIESAHLAHTPPQPFRNRRREGGFVQGAVIQPKFRHSNTRQ